MENAHSEPKEQSIVSISSQDMIQLSKQSEQSLSIEDILLVDDSSSQVEPRTESLVDNIEVEDSHSGLSVLL